MELWTIHSINLKFKFDSHNFDVVCFLSLNYIIVYIKLY